MSSTEEELARDFVVTFDGPALQGRMPVRDLAPSLLALGELFQRVQGIADPMGPEVSLEIRAIEAGSFGVGMHLSPSDVVNLLSSTQAIAVGNLIGIVCNSGQGLFALYKWLRGKIVTTRTEGAPNPGQVTIEDNHGNIFIADKIVFESYDNPEIRQLANKVVEPLRRPGVHELRFERDLDQDSVIIADEEVETFEAALQGVETVPQERTMELTVIGPVFKRGNKWRFSDGTRDDIWAPIRDETLWQQVASHSELFGAGDVLVARVEERQTLNVGGAPTRTELTILEVLEHRVGGGPQPPLFDSEDGAA